MSPLGELNLRNKFRAHELNFSQSADLAVKRILFRLKRLQASKHLLKGRMIETSANLSDMNEASLLVV